MQTEHRPEHKPQVCIGLVTYNGAARVWHAIDSVRRQTFQDWTLLISDNASTDDTEAICRRAAAGDPRIVYRRQPHNIGVWGNFKYVLAQADARYFMWMPDDYQIKERYLERVVALLDADDGLAFATSHVVMATDDDKPMDYQTESYKLTLHGDRGTSLVLRTLATREVTTLIYGVYRPAVLREAMQPYWGAQNVAFAWDALVILRTMVLGGLGVVPEFLLQTRFEDRWVARTWTFDHASLAGGFGFGYMRKALAALPKRLRLPAFFILGTRQMINVIYKLTYVTALYGVRGVFRKAANVRRIVSGKLWSRSVDQRTH